MHIYRIYGIDMHILQRTMVVSIHVWRYRIEAPACHDQSNLLPVKLWCQSHMAFNNLFIYFFIIHIWIALFRNIISAIPKRKWPCNANAKFIGYVLEKSFSLMYICVYMCRSMKSAFPKHDPQTWHWHCNWIGAYRVLEKGLSYVHMDLCSYMHICVYVYMCVHEYIWLWMHRVSYTRLTLGIVDG